MTFKLIHQDIALLVKECEKTSKVPKYMYIKISMLCHIK